MGSREPASPALKLRPQESSNKKKPLQLELGPQKSLDRRSSPRGTRGTEQSESASALSVEFRESECSEESDRQQDQLDTYINDREGYDRFLQELLRVSERLNKSEIMDTYLLSSIKNTQLRNAFK